VVIWGVLNSGVLTGKFLQETASPTRVDKDRLQLSEQALNTVKMVVQIAEEVGKPTAQVAINWVRQQQHRAQIIPLLGARSAEQLRDTMDCLTWELTTEQIDRLDEVSRIELGFPHDFSPGSPYIFGQTFNKIDNHRL